MRSRATVNSNQYALLLIVGAAIISVVVFFSGDRIEAQPAIQPTPTEIAADLDNYAKEIQNNLASQRDQVLAQLGNLQGQLPSVEEFVKGQPTIAAPAIPLPPTAVPVVLIPMATLPPTPIPVPPTPTPIPAQPGIGSVMKVDGIPHVMTPGGWMSCQGLYAYYGDNVDINDYLPFTAWFRSLSQPDRKFYFNICASASW